MFISYGDNNYTTGTSISFDGNHYINMAFHYIYIYIYIYIYVCVCARAHACVCVCINLRMNLRVYVFIVGNVLKIIKSINNVIPKKSMLV